MSDFVNAVLGAAIQCVIVYVAFKVGRHWPAPVPKQQQTDVKARKHVCHCCTHCFDAAAASRCPSCDSQNVEAV